MFKLDYNITKINFYLYLYNNEIYNDDKIEYLKKILFNNKEIKFNILKLIKILKKILLIIRIVLKILTRI